MDIPELNISVTKAAVNGQVVDVIDYKEYAENFEYYSDRSDVAIPAKVDDIDILLPYRGKYTGSCIPGVYNAGAIDFFVYPDRAFAEKYVSKNSVTMSNNDDIKQLIISGDKARKLDEPFITSPDCITNIPVRPGDQPEMKALKMALNSKNIDIDKYASRFGDNFPNDKRQLKSSSATLNIIKRYCNNCDMEAILILKDKSPDVPNPMGQEITVSLTEIEDENYNDNEDIVYSSDDSDEL